MIWQSGERAASARIEKVASRSPSARSAMTRLKGSPPNCASPSAAVMPASVSNRGRKPTAMTAVTPGSRPTASSLFSAGGLPTAGGSAVGRKLMADPPTLPGVRACRVEGPTGEDAISRSAKINVRVCPVTRGTAASRFRVDEPRTQKVPLPVLLERRTAITSAASNLHRACYMMIRTAQPMLVANRPVVLAVDDDEATLEWIERILQEY